MRKHTTHRPFQAVPDGLPPVGKERPYHIRVQVPVIDREDRFAGEYLHDRRMHLRPGREALGGKAETGLHRCIGLDHDGQAPAVLGPGLCDHPFGKLALVHKDSHRKTGIEEAERDLGRCRIGQVGNAQVKRGDSAPGRITVLHLKLSPCNFRRKGVGELLAQDAVEFDGMDDCTPVKQGAGERPIAGPDLEHPFSPHILKIRDPVYGMGIDEEVLVVVCFHRDVKT